MARSYGSILKSGAKVLGKVASKAVLPVAVATGVFGNAKKAGGNDEELIAEYNRQHAPTPAPRPQEPSSTPAPTPSPARGSAPNPSASKSTSSGSKSKSGGSNDIVASLLNDSDKGYDGKDAKTAQKAATEARKKAYDDRYSFLGEQIKSRQPELGAERERSLEGINAETANLLEQGRIGKEDIESTYATEETKLREAKEESDKELARIFQARGASDSSYYGDKVMQADKEFQRTLAKLGGDKGRRIAEYDNNLALYQKQAVDKKSKVESAYAQALKEIEKSLAMNDFEKEDALQQLESEYADKVGAIDDRIMNFGLQQQQFRLSVASFVEQQRNADREFGLAAGKAGAASRKEQEKLNESSKFKSSLPDYEKRLASITSEEDLIKEYARIKTESGAPDLVDYYLGDYLKMLSVKGSGREV